MNKDRPDPWFGLFYISSHSFKTFPNQFNLLMDQVKINSETYLKISNLDQMRPFLMSIVSDSNHWMFISSNGGLTAGRKNSDYSLFPYYTDDKITEGADNTGSKSLFWVEKDGQKLLWQPFSKRNQSSVSRNLYKNEYGDKVIFEEINHDLELTFQYQWCTSETFGFIKESTLINNSSKDVTVKLLDGLENIMPYGVPEHLQGIRSNLADAYKRNELDVRSGLGIFALSAIIVDRAEPSEALKANVAWSLGLDSPTHLLCSSQLEQFRADGNIEEERDIKATRGAYFVSKKITLAGSEEKKWAIVSEVNLDVAQVENLSYRIQNESNLWEQIQEDVSNGTKELIKLVASSDGLQMTADKQRNIRHYSNTLFNIMRGGIVDENYTVELGDFSKYLATANKEVSEKHHNELDALGASFAYKDVLATAQKSDDADFIRLATEYLPLKFSRRHGDPSRPWNKFSINTQNEDGSKVLDYEGNWRDIFQNWEALSVSFPLYIEGMISKFLNASTFDGYNPYRVTKDGFDWETIEPDDPWSYIGYWGDHQIIYLLKFLEIAENHFPEKSEGFFTKEIFVYANVPYKIKSYEDILKDPKDTIDFDQPLDHQIRASREKIGADGALITNQKGEIHHVNFIEKMLATTLAKLSNFIPEGGIWLNTQRPEWNDANNALVGNGVSMVTLYYLRRFFSFFYGLLNEEDKFELSEEVVDLFGKINGALQNHQDALKGQFSDTSRRALIDLLGEAGSSYREKIYGASFSGNRSEVKASDLQGFSKLVLDYLDHSIRANRRTDGMYHAYNLLTVDHPQEASISYLTEMLEGQVGVLSSGYLTGSQSLEVLDGMKSSLLFRPDQYSYLLYPNKELPGFLQKNILDQKTIDRAPLLAKLVADGNESVVKKDLNGNYHFHGAFRNAGNVREALTALSNDPAYADLVEQDRNTILEIYEELFNHKAFTGRSGTFFGYEGLGSIYWHMVSKLLLAVTEVCLKAKKENESAEIQGRLLEHFYEILEGIGVHKSPELYGAFPTDPYSHTPYGKGVQQPGMTGQVKEDILSRIAELGVSVRNGQIHFDPYLLRENEFLSDAANFQYVDVHGDIQNLEIPPKSLVFTYCQIPVVYEIADENIVTIQKAGGENQQFEGSALSLEVSSEVFTRTGNIITVSVKISKQQLK